MATLVMNSASIIIKSKGVTVTDEYRNGILTLNLDEYSSDLNIMFGTYKSGILGANSPQDPISPNMGVGAAGWDPANWGTAQGCNSNGYNYGNNELVGTLKCELIDATGANPPPARYRTPAQYTGSSVSVPAVGMAGALAYATTERLQESFQIGGPVGEDEICMFDPLFEVNPTNYASGTLVFGINGGVPRSQSLMLIVGQNKPGIGVRNRMHITFSGHGNVELVCPFTIA